MHSFYSHFHYGGPIRYITTYSCASTFVCSERFVGVYFTSSVGGVSCNKADNIYWLVRSYKTGHKNNEYIQCVALCGQAKHTFVVTKYFQFSRGSGSGIVKGIWQVVALQSPPRCHVISNLGKRKFYNQIDAVVVDIHIMTTWSCWTIFVKLCCPHYPFLSVYVFATIFAEIEFINARTAYKVVHAQL